MIDGFKCSCVGLSAEVWQQNPLLDFGLSVSESTGELLSQRREAKQGTLTFVLSPKGNNTFSCSVLGSLHKHRNNEGINWNDFTFIELTQTLNSIEKDFNINLNKASIHSLEVGVNLQVNYNPKQVFKSAICHKGKPFNYIDRRNKNLGIICEHTDYVLKLYDKGLQSNISIQDAYILRFEIKLKRQRMLEPYNISTLANLQCVENVASLLVLLLEKLNEIVFFDFSYSTDKLSIVQQINWERYSNPKYWETLNRKQYYTARQQYAKLIIKYDVQDYCKNISNTIVIKWIDLFKMQADILGHFPQLLNQIESRFTGTFSNLEYLLENVLNEQEKLSTNFLPIIHQNERRFCATCKRDISHQKKGSMFCSEKEFGKEAKRCRNKDSNKRLAIKRKIYRIMTKDEMLRITYTDENGNIHTDTLEIQELSITREWLDRILKVEKLTIDNPETLENEKAIKYLASINN